MLVHYTQVSDRYEMITIEGNPHMFYWHMYNNNTTVCLSFLQGIGNSLLYCVSHYMKSEMYSVACLALTIFINWERLFVNHKSHILQTDWVNENGIPFWVLCNELTMQLKNIAELVSPTVYNIKGYPVTKSIQRSNLYLC